MKRSDKVPKVVTTASKQARSETPPTPPLTSQLVVSFIATVAITRHSPPIPKGLEKKAKAIQPTKDASDLSSEDTLPNDPKSPLPKSSLGSLAKSMVSPSVATTRADTTAAKPLAQSSSPVAMPISLPSNPKPSSSKAKDKGKVVASSPMYSHENSYSHYFYEFENEYLFEKYITKGSLLKGP